MKKFYVPDSISSDFKYLVPSDNHYDLYNTYILEPNQNYTYYRFFYNLDSDFYTTNIRNTNYYDTTLNYTEIEPSSSYIYRNDYKDICFVFFVYFIFFIFLVNIFTSIIKRNGIFGGLL